MGAPTVVILACLAALAVAAWAARAVFAGEQGYLGSVLLLNGIPLLIGLVISLWLLRAARQTLSRNVAALPGLVPALIVMCWLGLRAVRPASIAPGIEHVLAPQVALLAAVLLGVLAWPLAHWLERRG